MHPSRRHEVDSSARRQACWKGPTPQPAREPRMAGQLTPEAIVALMVLKEKGQSNRQIARTLQVSEAAVRYRLRRGGRPHGRANKPHKADAVAEVIDRWVRAEQADQPDQPDQPDDGHPARPVNVRGL